MLLVDDHPQTRELTTLRLQVDGHHVLTASDAASAVAVATAGPLPDLVAVNVLLSEDGAGACVVDALRANDTSRGLPIVTFLAYSGTVAIQGLALGEVEVAQGQALLRLLSAMNSLNQPSYAPAK